MIHLDNRGLNISKWCLLCKNGGKLCNIEKVFFSESRHEQEKIKQQIFSIVFKQFINTKFQPLSSALVQLYKAFSQVLHQLLKKRQTLTQNFKQLRASLMLHFGIKLITKLCRILLTEQHSTTESIK